jgi:hypothetical protein
MMMSRYDEITRLAEESPRITVVIVLLSLLFLTSLLIV